MSEQELKRRTKDFALRVLSLIDALPEKRSTQIIARQLGRSGTSVGANYRSACRARSAADMINKLSIVEEEADESAYWLELLVEHQVVPASRAARLLEEANQLTAIMVASRRTLSRNQKAKIGNRNSP